MQVLNAMSFLIEQVGASIAPHSHSLVQHLPLLWQESEEHNLLRCAIVNTLMQLVEVGHPPALASYAAVWIAQ